MLLFCSFLYLVFSFLSANAPFAISESSNKLLRAKDLHAHICRSLLRGWLESPSGCSTLRAVMSHSGWPVYICKPTCSRCTLYRLPYSLSPQPPNCQLSESHLVPRTPRPGITRPLQFSGLSSRMCAGDPAQDSLPH